MWVRGLKRTENHLKGGQYESHPMWVRGLKRKPQDIIYPPMCVAPYVGAWIETFRSLNGKPLARSHPMWVRGLKHLSKVILWITIWSHPMWVRGLKQ